MNEDFRFQLSIRIDGQHLLNVRSGNAVDFGADIRSAVDDAEMILSACRALEGRQMPQQPSAVRVMGGNLKVSSGAPQPSSGPSAEFGPVLLQGVSSSSTKRDGTPMKSPKFTVNVGGKSLSTFDASLGQSAMTLNGQKVFYTTETKGDFVNLASIRSAG
jgi:hypothetical protein